MSDIVQPANYQEIADALDAQVANDTITMEQALRSAQASGLTTGPGGYEPVGWRASEEDRLNRESRQSAARSAAYQQTRVNNPEGYTQESQEAFNAEHPLSEY